MNGSLQTRLKPNVPPQGIDFSTAPVANATPKAKDGGEPDKKVAFKDLVLNSNDDVVKQRVAQKNGDGLRSAKTNEEFAKMLQDQFNKDNLRKPQNSLDKDAFLKLFITQMQNQDPLNPDNSAQMAAQLAQFHGLEQMLNVNKNLEKMQTEQLATRSVGLLSFVGKDLKLDNGKVRLNDGQITKAFINLKQDAPRVSYEVRDSAGVLVANKDIGYLPKGEHKLTWEGKNAAGEKVSDGNYTLNVMAKDLNDQDIPIDVYSFVKVTGVDLKDSGGSFDTDVGKVGIGEVVSVGVDQQNLGQNKNSSPNLAPIKVPAVEPPLPEQTLIPEKLPEPS